MAQHLSIRVPWHDNNWSGCVCTNPTENNSCLRLKNVYENRNDNLEKDISGCMMSGNEQNLPCISEGGAFMSPKSLYKITEHPYKKSNPETHGHFLETKVEYPPFSFPARPFARLMKDRVEEDAKHYNIPINLEYEPHLSFKTNWVQDARNHRAIFESFYDDVIPEKSLCIAYAKQVPFIEDTRRVVIGIGKVKKIIPAIEHNHTNDGELRSMIWETMICHSIRNDHNDGFVFPYKEMMEYAKENPEFDISSITVFAPDDYFEEFSYATEHLSYDAVIDVLLQSIKSLSTINNCLDSDWSQSIRWLNERLAEVWKDRGAFPGLGAMLCAMGIDTGIVIYKKIKELMKDNDDIWDVVDKVINNPNNYLSKELSSSIKDIHKIAWNKMPNERKTLFKLLSRFSFTITQAEAIFNNELRNKNNINCSDAEIIENPYILYELTRDKIDELYISIKKVDMAVFPIKSIEKEYPIPYPSRLSSDNDQRRIRAIAISILENEAMKGHTFLPSENLILKMRDFIIEPKCNVTLDIVAGIEDFLKDEITTIKVNKNQKGYKLKRYEEIDELIKNIVLKKINKAKPNIVNTNWRELIDKTFKESDKSIEEERAREEKAAVLKELAQSRVSVLVGDAGTGKTSLLSILCKANEIKAGGIILLAPTGKARVRMMESIESNSIEAYTIAQYLMKSKRYDFRTMKYRLSMERQDDVPNTVIIDESSMLTEEMFGALLQAVRSAKRIIFVGDPNQLPPIGAGRPFVDLVTYLKKGLKPNIFPRVCKGYGELTVHRRQKDEERLDVKLSECYSTTSRKFDLDIFEQLSMMENTKNIEFRQWSAKEDLENLILDSITKELNMKNQDDVEGFNASLGATNSNGYDYFNYGCAKIINKWQILCPVKNMPHGVLNINRLIHNRYRSKFIELSKEKNYRKKIPRMMGPENIVYGDKIINVINQKRSTYDLNIHKTIDGYVANGEIGMATADFGNKKTLKFLKVEYLSQPRISYSYSDKDFSEEDNSIPLELAYALTVHKSQGSEFEKVILVLSEPCSLISREMMYTALTRQTEKLIILYNQEPYKLKNYTSMEHSDIAKRFTDLFEEPDIVKVKEKYYENRLIHKTAKGDMVRSKSEVIIADCLYHNNIEYKYEESIELEGNRLLPDFIIIDDDTDEQYIWEHCGMMDDEKYKARWNNKKAIYEKNGYIEGENLIVTYDEHGTIDSQKIQKIVEDKFL
ncbi:MAG: AAA family ATPase [Clostridiaceae bacterium]|nr:AAA family ATPase [Clostridiaceae bacterium]